MVAMIYFGCDYYPEQWRQWLEEGEARWKTDAQLMREAGMNVVRLAEFAWGLLEPEPDHFDFTWLDRAIDVLHHHDLKVVLCTPTPTPPPWLLAEHPDIAQVTASGRRQGPGTRREGCANHPIYRERSRIISQEMVRYYADHPAVIGWQTDNEFGCHDSAYCYCRHCERAFRTWLAARYGSLEALNQAWGTAFWGEVYADWDLIPLPSLSAAERNPSHLLDFRRFGSDTWRDFHNMEIEILRRHCPHHFITHNLMGFFMDLDYYDLCQELDFVSWDNYHYHGATPATIAATHDHMWGILQRNFWVMEQQVGQINWSAYNPMPAPGFVRLKTYQALAHGADGIVYFRWRQALAGSEQYHSGLLDHAGRKTAGYAEAQQIGSELARLAPVLEATQPQAEIAILLDYDSRWALEIQPHTTCLRANVDATYTVVNPATLVDPDATGSWQYMIGRAWQMWPFAAPYVALWERNIPVAIVAPESDLSRYKVVCAPFLNLLRPAVVEALRGYVHGGGTLILGPRAGLKDQHNKLFPMPQPGPLSELTSASVRFFDVLEPNRTHRLVWPHASDLRATEIGLWAEVLDANGAEVLATYEQGWYAGEAAITRHRAVLDGARGQTIYLGCMGGPQLYHRLFDLLLGDAGVEPILAAPAGVEVMARVARDGRRVVFLLNHAQREFYVTLPHEITDLLTGLQHGRRLSIAAGQVIIYEDQAAAAPATPT
ncbi:MAG: beta-galactosidase [Caldilineaceae bacterium]|nr:beta-galactosidase [Caldilineaceae bacterium]